MKDVGRYLTTTKRKEKFVRDVMLYIIKDNYLDKLYRSWEAQLPEKLRTRLKPPPALGNLDINQLAESKYFFS